MVELFVKNCLNRDYYYFFRKFMGRKNTIMKNFTVQLIAVGMAAMLFTGCASTKTTSKADNQDKSVPVATKTPEQNDANTVQVGAANSIQLVDYLRRIPGLQIHQRGNEINVTVRGVNSLTGNQNPLFVVNRNPVGNSYDEAVMAVDVNDIRTVNVIKGPEGQQMYGTRAANGVVQILTKRK